MQKGSSRYGRPKIRPEQAKSESLLIHLTVDERQQCEAAATAANQSLSAWFRRSLWECSAPTYRAAMPPHSRHAKIEGLRVRLTVEEKRRFEAAAAATHQSVNAWVRSNLWTCSAPLNRSESSRPTSRATNETMRLRVTSEERRQFDVAAAATHQSLNDWIRISLLACSAPAKAVKLGQNCQVE